MKHKVRSRKIICNRNIVYDSNTQQRFYIRIVGLCFQWIPQKDHKINLPFYDLRSNLLISAKRTATVSFYRKPCSLSDKTRRCSCSA